MNIRFSRLSIAGAALGIAALALPTVAAPPKSMHHSAPTAPVVRMMTSKGLILIKLYPKDAPLSVANFEKLVKKGFYNGLTFHRITDLGDPGASKIVQGGSLHGDGGQGSDQNVKGEFSTNGVQNPLTHIAGAVALARTDDPNSANSQFYICVNPVHFLDGKYAVFGQVIKGLDVAGKLQVGDKMTKVTMAKP